jgi:hypothetical protein
MTGTADGTYVNLKQETSNIWIVAKPWAHVLGENPRSSPAFLEDFGTHAVSLGSSSPVLPLARSKMLLPIVAGMSSA